MSWNVRDLNGKACHDSVREFDVHERVSSVLCLQETKLQAVCTQATIELIGPMFDYVCLEN